MTRTRTNATSPRLPWFRRGRPGRGAPIDRGARARAAGRRQVGMTLVEVIVAATLALIGFLVALVLYSAARNLFKKGEQATDQQQEVRVAYDMMLKDLRLAGYNWNASGEERPGEEQIEGAWAGAITVRGDFDFEQSPPTSTKSVDPEDLIAGSTNKATVGNDEIVTYCLRPMTGTLSTQADFNADVDSGATATSALYGNVAVRDGTREDLSVLGVPTGGASTQTNPPYNLYRVTLNNAKSTFGSTDFYQWTLLASNIKSLEFTYRDANGTPITAPGGLEAAKDARASIKKIDVTVIGMTALADNNYTDPADTSSTQHFRKFSLTTQIAPRNLGFKGRADVDTNPPTTPTGLAVCSGHCSAMVAKWNANPSSEGVALYTVKYGLSAGALNQVISTSGTNVYIAGLTEDTTYYFAVRASDAGGNNSSYTSTVSGVIGDLSPTVTTPSMPGGFAATGGGTAQNGYVDLTWNAVTTNTTPLACDPVPTTIRDLAGYRLYRSTTSAFAPADTLGNNMVVSETDPAMGPSAATYRDRTVVNCRQYYYHLKAVDTSTCTNKSATMGSSVNGQSNSGIAPAAPVLIATSRTGTNSASVAWTGVTQDTGSPVNTISIDKYNIWRCQINTSQDPETATYTAVSGSPFTCTTPTCLFADATAPADQGGKKLWYKVSAKDDCPNESARSSASEAACSFNGVVSIVPQSSPPDLTNAAQTVTVAAVGGDTFTSATLTISKQGGSQDFSATQTVTGNNWNFTWTPSQGAGNYVGVATVINSNSCVGTSTNIWTVNLVACSTCATIPANNPDPTAAAPKYYRSQNFINNSCAFPLQITRVIVKESTTSTCTNATFCNTLKLQKIQYIQTGSFADETSNVVWTSPVGGGSTVAPGTSVTADFSTTPLNLGASSSGLAKMRFIFDQTTPTSIWTLTCTKNQDCTGSGNNCGTSNGFKICNTITNDRKHTIIGDFSFNQVSSLCAPATVSSQLD